MIRIVMRNQGNGRKDAVYILDIPPNLSGEYSLVAYWGRWNNFLHHKFVRLRWQSKYRGFSRADLIEAVRCICSDKLQGGYEIQENHSLLPEWPILPFGQDWRHCNDSEP